MSRRVAPLKAGPPASPWCGGLRDALADFAARVRYEPARGVCVAEDGRQSWSREPDAVHALCEAIYARYFCRWSPGEQRGRYAHRSSGEPSFVAALSAASRGATYWELGWRLVKSDGEWAFVSNGRLCLFIDDRAQLKPESARDGTPVQVRLPCARENLTPGFFYLVGRAGPIDDRAPHVKVYLNLAAEAVPPLIEALLTRPTVDRLRFEGKFVNDPAAYCRVDTGLLYVEPSSYAGLLALMLGLKRSHPGWWRKGTPLFTRELSDGLSVAEAPRATGAATLESFGRHRCRLVAEAVLEALKAGEPFGPSWLSRAQALFAQAGISVDPPHVKELKASRSKHGVSFEMRPRR